MIHTYEALAADGRKTTSTVEAPDARQAVEQLRRSGLYVTEIREASGAAPEAAERFRGGPGRLPLRTLAVFTRQMAMLLHAGSGLVPAMAAIRRQLRKPAQARLLDDIITDLEGGVTLSEALRKHPSTFDPVYCAVVAAGEASATLTDMFERLATLVAKQRALRNKVLGALAYPALLVVMSASILGSLLFFVIPRFNNMFEQLGVQPPTTTKMLLSTSTALSRYWPAAVAAGLALAAGVYILATSGAGRQWLADLQLQLPGLRTLRARMIQVQVFRTMGMLLESGVGVLDTLHLVRRSTGARRFQQLFDRVEEGVTAGGRFSAAFDESGLIEPHICQAITTGEESGNIGGALSYCTESLDESNTEVINALMRLLEPVILIGMGFVVGGVAVSLFLPLFDMTSAMH